MRTSKDHVDYWKTKLRKQKAPRSEWETVAKARDWEVYVQFRGRREWFNFHTPNREVAATKARELWRTLVGSGADAWEKACQRFKPEMCRIISSPTVGQFLAEVERCGPLKKFTFETYARKLRTVVAAIRGVPDSPKRFDYRRGGDAQWRAEIESTKLSAITVYSVQEWKNSVLKRAGDDNLAQLKARRTINSVLRNAKALFAPKILKLVPVQVGAPLPFEGVEFERASMPKYVSKVDPSALLAAAMDQLKGHDDEAYKIFLLALAAGLRRREIDGLTWTQIDLTGKTIRVETTSHTALKTEDSDGIVDIPDWLVSELAALRPACFTDFVVSGALEMATRKRYHAYRCDAAFSRLICWLRSNGVQDLKPIHLLRKEFGSNIAAKGGIYAASRQLRHGQIATTVNHYLDKKQAIVFDVKRIA